MWRAYSSTVVVTDLASALNYLLDEFDKNVFEYEHEAVYGMEKVLPIEECTRIAKNNEIAIVLTTLFQDNTICGSCWMYNLLKLDKFRELGYVFKYLPDDVKYQMAFPSSTPFACDRDCKNKIQIKLQEEGYSEL